MDLAGDMLRRTITLRIANVTDFGELLRTCIMKSTWPFFVLSRAFGCSTMVPQSKEYLRVALQAHSAILMLACVVSFILTIIDFDRGSRNFTDVTFLHIGLVLNSAFVLISIVWARLVEQKLPDFVKLFKSVNIRGLREQNSSIVTWLCIAYILSGASYDCVICILQFSGVIRLPAQSLLVEKVPILAYLFVPPFMFFFTGARSCCLCLQVLTVTCAGIAVRQFNKNLSRTREITLPLVQQWRAEFGRLVQLMRFLDSCWRYYYAFFQLTAFAFFSSVLYVLTNLQDHGTKLVLVGTLMSNIVIILASQIPAIVSNEEMSSSHFILTQKEAELPTRVSNSDKTEYFHQLSMLRAEMETKESLLSSGGAFRMSRALLVVSFLFVLAMLVGMLLIQSNCKLGARNATTASFA